MGANPITNVCCAALPGVPMNIVPTPIAADFNRQFSRTYKPGFLGDEAVIVGCQFRIDPPMHLIVTPDDVTFVEGETRPPTLTLYLDERNTLRGLLDGSIDGMDAFMAERYRSDGHIVYSQLLLYAFRGTPVSADEVVR